MVNPIFSVNFYSLSLNNGFVIMSANWFSDWHFFNLYGAVCHQLTDKEISNTNMFCATVIFWVLCPFYCNFLSYHQPLKLISKRWFLQIILWVKQSLLQRLPLVWLSRLKSDVNLTRILLRLRTYSKLLWLIYVTEDL